eukprot:COSAG02_NODE_5780_length_4039_cov_9.386041_3_plen_89_part_00
MVVFAEVGNSAAFPDCTSIESTTRRGHDIGCRCLCRLTKKIKSTCRHKFLRLVEGSVKSDHDCVATRWWVCVHDDGLEFGRTLAKSFF